MHMPITEILKQIKGIYVNLLRENLVGIYVHGSLAFGCFAWEKSDVDFLAVVREPLLKEEKEAIVSALLTLDVACPPKGLEMSIILERFCKPFVYPTPYELHFSNDHKERFQTHFHEHCESLHGTDKDLAAHITVIRHTGILLYGKPIDAVFGEVSRADYLDSLLFDIENADADMEENPTYFILNLCRVLAYLQEGCVLSKKQGGEWGIKHLPVRYRVLIAGALADYACENTMKPCALMHDFAKELLYMIHKEMET